MKEIPKIPEINEGRNSSLVRKLLEIIDVQQEIIKQLNNEITNLKLSEKDKRPEPLSEKEEILPEHKIPRGHMNF